MCRAYRSGKLGCQYERACGNRRCRELQFGCPGGDSTVIQRAKGLFELLEICFLREAPETAVGRTGGRKMGKSETCREMPQKRSWKWSAEFIPPAKEAETTGNHENQAPRIWRILRILDFQTTGLTPPANFRLPLRGNRSLSKTGSTTAAEAPELLPDKYHAHGEVSGFDFRRPAPPDDRHPLISVAPEVYGGRPW